jgi:predicted glycosyl hydrolase (DUF1957 family)
MSQLLWINFFHLYQPPRWRSAIIRLVARQSYRPFFRYLINHPKVRLTLNLTGALTEQLNRLGEQEILSNIRLLLRRGQIEPTGSAMYHPILPLIPVTEAKRQIQLNTITNQKFLGESYRPSGFFFPEMAYSQTMARLAVRLGFTWTILDEITAGQLGNTDISQPYRIADTPMAVVLRNRWLSDLFFMAELKNAQSFWNRCAGDPRTNKLLITACDGENLGHHNPTLLRTWHRLVEDKGVETITISDWLKRNPATKSIHLRSSSWAAREIELRANQPFYLWRDPANPIQKLQWQITKILLTVSRSTNLSPAHRRRLDEMLASDQYWWASASPWWDTHIIIRAVNSAVRFATDLYQAKQLSKHQSEIIQKSADQIINTVRTWQRSGEADERHRKYLAAEPFARYFGGQKVK